jgi:hypothetical protein
MNGDQLCGGLGGADGAALYKGVQVCELVSHAFTDLDEPKPVSPVTRP